MTGARMEWIWFYSIRIRDSLRRQMSLCLTGSFRESVYDAPACWGDKSFWRISPVIFVVLTPGVSIPVLFFFCVAGPAGARCQSGGSYDDQLRRLK